MGEHEQDKRARQAASLRVLFWLPIVGGGGASEQKSPAQNARGFSYYLIFHDFSNAPLQNIQIQAAFVAGNTPHRRVDTGEVLQQIA